ncbi:MAG: hypothetical protein R3185_00085 [Candidatus Thermoplasmatota archaeon]|nr:hypothetical protein [Candidatus Thermoplasmatota archaeon]
MIRPTRTSTTQPRDKGVSVILGAMLLTGILMSAYVAYQVSVVPTLDAAAEATHMREVGGQLSNLRSELDRQVENRTMAPTAVPISLGASNAGSLGEAGASGSLRFDPNDKPVRLWSNRLLVQQLNGTLVGGTSEDWRAADGASVEEIVEVLSFRLRVDEVSRTHDGDSLTVNVRDLNNDPAGSLEVYVTDPLGTNYHVNIRVLDASGNVLYDEPRAYHHTNDVSPYWVDMLSPEYRFDRVLSDADKPLSVSLTGDGLDGDYAITYKKQTSTGTTRLVSGGGVVYDSWKRTWTGGTLVYQGVTDQFEAQSYKMETGGLILAQQQGAVFKVRPHFKASLPDNVASITLTIPTLRGDTASASGGGTGTVYLTPEDQYRVRGEASNVSLEITTDHPDLWTELWRTELVEAGLTEGTGFDIGSTATTAKLDIWGLLDPDPASDEYDVYLTLHQARIDVDVDG